MLRLDGLFALFFKRIDGIKKIHHFTLEKHSLLQGDFLAQESIVALEK